MSIAPIVVGVTDGEDAAAALNQAIAAANFQAGGIDLNGRSMVHFPDTADLFKATALTTTNSKVGTCSFLFNDLGICSSTVTVIGNESLFEGDGRGLLIQVAFYITADYPQPRVVVDLAPAGAAGIGPVLQVMSWRSGEPNHVLISWDTTSPTNALLACYVNGVPSIKAGAIGADFDIDYTSSGDVGVPGFIGVNARTARRAFDVGEVFLDTAHSIVTPKNAIARADVEKFLKNGQVQSLGADGSTPFGVAPAVYFRGNAASFPTNRGTGGAFTLTGSIADA